MRVAYADPPYPGQAARHYADHPDYAGEVDHQELEKGHSGQHFGRCFDRSYDAWPGGEPRSWCSGPPVLAGTHTPRED